MTYELGFEGKAGVRPLCLSIFVFLEGGWAIIRKDEKEKLSQVKMTLSKTIILKGHGPFGESQEMWTNG